VGIGGEGSEETILSEYESPRLSPDGGRGPSVKADQNSARGGSGEGHPVWEEQSGEKHGFENDVNVENGEKKNGEKRIEIELSRGDSAAGDEKNGFEPDAKSRNFFGEKIEVISETKEPLFESYPTWVSFTVVLAVFLYTALILSALSGRAFVVETNVQQITGKNGTESAVLQTIGDYRLYDFLRLTWEFEAFASCIFILLFSFLWPVVISVLLLVVWFAKISLRARARNLRWISRLGTMNLFFFYFVLVLCALLQIGFKDSQGNPRVLRGSPEWAVYVYFVDVLLLLVFAEWIYVLHYNAVYALSRQLKLHGEDDSGKYRWYFGSRSDFIKACCCVNALIQTKKIQLPENPKSFVNLTRSHLVGEVMSDNFQGWRFASQRSNGESARPPKLISSDMEFVRGPYKYACSKFGLFAGFLWVCIIFAFGVLAFFLPSVESEVTDGDLILSQSSVRLSRVGSRLLSNIGTYGQENDGGLVFLVLAYYILVALLPGLSHVFIALCLFAPMERLVGRKWLRAIGHVTNILVSFASFETAILAVIVVSFEFFSILEALFAGEAVSVGESPLSRTFGRLTNSVCFNSDPDELENLCLSVGPESGLIWGTVVAVINIPFLYYFAETYHRHFGLIADGRNEMAYRTGETTHKHRAEGCLVFMCFLGRCCSRKENTFNQEPINENLYYGDEEEENFFDLRQKEEKSEAKNDEQLTAESKRQRRFSFLANVALLSRRWHQKARGSLSHDDDEIVARSSSMPKEATGHSSSEACHEIKRKGASEDIALS